MPQKNNYIYRRGTSPNTRLLNTQRVRVFSFDPDAPAGTFAQIGVVQTWSPTQSRSIEPWRGIGFGDQISELGVGVTDMTASCTMLLMYMKNVMQAFGFKAGASGLIRSLKHHRWPFDVKETIVLPDLITGLGEDQGNGVVSIGSDRAIVTIYEGCWMTDYTQTFNIGDTSCSMDTSFTVTDVYAEPMADYEADLTDAADSNKLASAMFASQ